jgi:putative membrane protein
MSGRDLDHIVEIMKRDFKGAFSNPIVTVVLIAIIILPSLYALLNIQACWNPYENTDEVVFAIANLDNGTSYEGKTLNVGNELVKELKNNDKFDWTFVSEDELRRGVHDGDYYAGIIIPKNLSESILSITSDNPHQAKLEYIVNVKSNPVATKLTDSGANSVYTKLNAKIVEIINLAAYGKLGELQEGLASGASQLSSGGSQLKAGADKVTSGADKVKTGADKISSSSDKVKTGADKVKDGSAKVKKGAGKVKDGSNAVQKGSSEINKGTDAVKQGSSQVSQGASQVEQGSQQIQSQVDPSSLPEPYKDYVEGNIKLANASGEVAKGSTKLADGSVQLAESSSKLANGASDVAGGASDVADGASDVAGGAGKVAKGSGKLADGSVELAEGSVSLAAGAGLLSDSAAQALYTASAALTTSADSLAGVTGVNESQLGNYLFSPVKLDRHELFPVPDYGSNISPFYIVLSMWVGAILTCVMIPPGTSVGTKYSPFEVYFGKLLFFVIMSILQACVTIIGCYLLGIHIDNSPLFIFSAVLVSVVFMILMYSIISAIGNVGKGIAVILLVLQISATGGIYPVEIMHHVFQAIHPYMPMTYAITLIREAQLGVVWSNYLPALAILLAIGVITVVVAIIIKKKADKQSHYFEEKLAESGLFGS